MTCELSHCKLCLTPWSNRCTRQVERVIIHLGFWSCWKQVFLNFPWSIFLVINIIIDNQCAQAACYLLDARWYIYRRDSSVVLLCCNQCWISLCTNINIAWNSWWLSYRDSFSFVFTLLLDFVSFKSARKKNGFLVLCFLLLFLHLFTFDDPVIHLQLISATHRHRQSTDHPIKFISRRPPYYLKFKIKPGNCLYFHRSLLR